MTPHWGRSADRKYTFDAAEASRFVLLDGNPLEHIGNARRVNAVVWC